MLCRFAWLILFTVAASAAGCTSCASPYDGCGPVYGTPEGPGDFRYRKNSVLGGDPALTPLPRAKGMEIIAEPTAEPAAEPAEEATPAAE